VGKEKDDMWEHEGSRKHQPSAQDPLTTIVLHVTSHSHERDLSDLIDLNDFTVLNDLTDLSDLCDLCDTAERPPALSGLLMDTAPFNGGGECCLCAGPPVPCACSCLLACW
jgi:hypothetical protein